MKIESFAPDIQFRYNFTFNFLVGAATFSKMSKEIEDKGKKCPKQKFFNINLL